MTSDFTDYETGDVAVEKENLLRDRKAATTKTPAAPIKPPTATPTPPAWRQDVLINNPVIRGCTVFQQDANLSITYLSHQKISASQQKNISVAISYLTQAQTSQAILKDIRAKSDLMVFIYFFASIADYPYPEQINSTDECGQTNFMSTPASPGKVIYIAIFLDKIQGQSPECIATCLFHEFMHVWWLATQSSYDIYNTGHTATAQEKINDADCTKTYIGYEPKFQRMLEAFDNDLEHKIPGAKKCCS